ncbi:MAG: class I SAM-dependent methyltransferase [Opitutaceae bacterium]|nr:class I SAM-dependent methyltransferase [Opitutaceae bacterium]
MSTPKKSWLRLLPFGSALRRENERLRAELAQLRAQQEEWARFFPPGHFYSPLPSREETAEAFARGGFGPPFPAIDLNEAGQVARLERFASFYPEQPFPETKTEGRRFHLDNASYGHFDAIMLWCMLREARPRRIVEVGSGFSSAAMLDLNDGPLGGGVQFTFIDPDMKRLRPLLRPDDERRTTLIEKRVQEVPLDPFRALGENDVLFIDSSHVSKIGSDVNRLFFDVLPALAPGVLIHIHDVAGNLEYPREWLDEGRAWNEQYLLRAFLMNNRDYRIELFTGWLFNTRHAWFREHMPLCARGGGGQIWLRKLV